MSTAKELKKEIERGVWDASLGRLYGRRAGVLERQRARYADALDCFAALYGGEREAAIYSAPGRTEIGGNHTDHNHGVVMAGAVDLDVIAAAWLRASQSRAVYWAASTPIPRPMCCAAQGCPVRLRSRLSLVLYSMGNTTKAVSPR